MFKRLVGFMVNFWDDMEFSLLANIMQRWCFGREMLDVIISTRVIMMVCREGGEWLSYGGHFKWPI